MNIAENTFVSLTYTLTVNGKVVDKAESDRPLEFVYGIGMLLPKFEEYIAGKSVGDKFEFILAPAEGYGEHVAENVIDLPKNLFEIDGKVDDSMLVVGNVLPMSDHEGHRLMGTIKAVGDNTVTMDFNHPMAGETLHFTGEITGVRPATEADYPHHSCGGGCGDGGCCGECNC
ncbi:MAG: FKBP-type peptidyl-prolyl cis-trans isomerase [Rikenellaceae bacterium]|nr:FKBP-type peptidyl-prolyl cis-trans isomerase [Rikenellaceae bacterium]MDE7355153.1 FKBP-type peptidyl-prolyl cis-trans isomerase [Rikenellaceae bacterium]